MKTVFLTTYFDVQTQPVVECPRDIGGGGGGGGHDVSAGADAAGAAAKAAPAAPPAPSDTGGGGLKELRGDDAAGAAAKAPKAAPSESPSEIPAAKVIASSVHRFFNNSVFRCVMKIVFLTTYFDVLTQTVGDAVPADTPAVEGNAAAAFSVHSFLNDQGCCEQLLVKTVFSDLF